MLKKMGRLLRRLQHIGIIQKMIIGYVFVVFVPTLLFSVLFYNQLYGNMLNDFKDSKQKILEQSYNNLKTDFLQTDTLGNFFQMNTNITDYLLGANASEANQLYTFLRDIRPLMNYVYSVNPMIDNIVLYKKNASLIQLRPEVRDITELGGLSTKLDQLKPMERMWLYSSKNPHQAPELTYYRKLYNYNYSKELGVLMISFNSSFFNQFVDHLQPSEGGAVYVFSTTDRFIYERKTEDLPDSVRDQILEKALTAGSAFIVNKAYLVSSLEIKELNLELYMVDPVQHMINSRVTNRNYYMAAVALLLFALSLLYYLITISVVRRIIKLARHMGQVDTTNLAVYSGTTGNDEIGQLITSYNSMISRIEELINTVHRSEIMRKEAAYQVMQAQIRPHFLYNTLESIRMLAEMNQDTDVADMTYTFGKFLRYSLSDKSNETTLLEETENVKQFLQIHKVRMGDRLEYELDIRTDIAHFVCPRFILQPLAENTIIHGTSIKRKCVVSITVQETDGGMIVQIADNGAGIASDRLEEIHQALEKPAEYRPAHQGGGLGLANVNERIKIYFGEGSGLRIDSRFNEGTTITLLLLRKGDGGHV